MAYVKHKVKRFNPELGEFEYTKFKGDPMVLEMYRYVSAQIIVQRAKLNKLINAILAGTAYSSFEVETKVNELNKRAEILISRANLVMSSVDELETATTELKKGVLSEEILRRYGAVRDQIINIEHAFGKLASMRAPELFESMMRDLENIANRIHRIENIAGESADILLKNRLNEAKRYVKLFGKNAGGLER